MIESPVSTNSTETRLALEKARHKQANERTTGQEFETMVLKDMLENMFKGVETDGLFGAGHSEEIWRSFMLDEYAKLMAERGAIGIGQNIDEMLSKYHGSNLDKKGQ